jgi:hypothetical protein
MKFERGIFAVLVLGLLVGGNEAVAMNAFTRVGPDLAYYNGLNLFSASQTKNSAWYLMDGAAKLCAHRGVA